MSRKAGITVAILVVLAAGVWAALELSAGAKSTNGRLGRRVTRRLHDLQGHARGWRYRLAGRHPDLDVADDVLADRVRSELGPLEKRLDLPHVHVMVEDHVALLHGEVATLHDAEKLERAVEAVPGVAGVESHLHVGLLRGDTRPSTGRDVQSPSRALHQLLAAAQHAGAHADGGWPAVRAVLSTLADRIPEDERQHLLSHLPEDVRVMATPPRRRGEPMARVRHVDEFVGAVAAAGPVDADRAQSVVASVLGALRQLVPEEAVKVADVLPAELRELWNAAVPR